MHILVNVQDRGLNYEWFNLYFSAELDSQALNVKFTKTQYIFSSVIIEFDWLIDWLVDISILTACQPIWGYSIPRS